MPQLIQMRNRMKAVETIKKITHAMRLIAMSTHVRLRDQEPFFREYQNEIEQLFLSLYKQYPLVKNPLFNPPAHNKSLCIIIGSQKGLCGNFNDLLFKLFEKKLPSIAQETTDIITLGKKAYDFIKAHKIPVARKFDLESSHKITQLAHALTDAIINVEQPYSSVVILSNYPITFFGHKTHITQLIPISAAHETKKIIDLEDYEWEEKPAEILQHLAELHIIVALEYAIFQSLLAEQAARFVSMDSSTRNAKDVLETMQIQYNKLRQAKITKELTELSSSFQNNIGT